MKKQKIGEKKQITSLHLVYIFSINAAITPLNLAKTQMKRILLTSVLLLTSVPAFADNSWTYETDDGRKISTIQVNRDAAACATVFYGMVGPGWKTCMASKGYIVHICTNNMWRNGMCESGFLQGLH